MADLSAFLKDCGSSCSSPTCTEWNQLLQELQKQLSNLEQAQAGPIVSLSDEATVSVDWANGSVQRVVVTDDRTLSFSGAVSGQRCVLIYVQDGMGGHTPTWDAKVRWAGGSPVAPASGANKTTYYGLLYNDADDKYDVVSVSSDH